MPDALSTRLETHRSPVRRERGATPALRALGPLGPRLLQAFTFSDAAFTVFTMRLATL